MKRWSGVTGVLVLSFFLLVNMKMASAEKCTNADQVLNKLLSDQRIKTMVDDAYLAGYVIDEILPQIVDLAYDLGYDPDELNVLLAGPEAECWKPLVCSAKGCCANSPVDQDCVTYCYGRCHSCSQ